MGNLKWAKDQIDKYISENGHKLEAQTAYNIYKNLDIYCEYDIKIVLDLLNKLNEKQPLLKIDLAFPDKDFCAERTYQSNDDSHKTFVVFRSKSYPSLTLTNMYFGNPMNDILIGRSFSDINRLSTNFNIDDRFLDIAINDILDELKPIKIDDYPDGKYEPIPGEWEAELEWKCTYDLDYPDFVRIKYFVNRKRNPKNIPICEVDRYLRRGCKSCRVGEYWIPVAKEDWDNAESFTDDASDI